MTKYIKKLNDVKEVLRINDLGFCKKLASPS
jgi:hypothetical protein